MIAVTGINGLLGSFIARQLRAENYSVVGITRSDSDLTLVQDLNNTLTWRTGDVLDPISLVSCFENVETVIHAAGMVSFNPRRADEIFAVNTEGTKNVVNACLKAGVKKLIFISSVAALGRQKSISVLNEDSKWVEGPLNSQYAKSKYLAELEVYRGQEEGLQVAIINPSIILAPTNWNKSSAQIFKYIWDERKFYTHGQMNFVDARDVAAIVSIILNRNIFGEKFIANGGAIEWSEIFKKIADRLKRKPPSIAVSKRLASLVAGLEEMRARVLGYEPVVTRQSVKMAKGKFYYSNEKSINRLEFKYRTIENTLDWCCDEYLRLYTTNKD